jgi:serine/threonine protein kinase
MQEQQIQFLFENNQEILNVIATHGEISNILSVPNERCSLIGSEIKLTDKIGKGKFGEVFLITIPGLGTKHFVVKKVKAEYEIISGDNAFWMEYFEDTGQTWDYLKNFQSEDTIDRFENDNYKNISFIIPPAGTECLMKQDRTYDAIPQSESIKTITVPKNSYLCENEVYVEYLIGIYTGKIYRDFECINFFNMYSMFACPDSGKYFNQYIFMDKLDGDIEDNIGCISIYKYLTLPKTHHNDVMNGIYIQTLFAIAIYQDRLQLSHNDLHTGNLFIEVVTKNTIYNNQSLIDADLYHYHIKDKDIYIPAIPVIVKIGDYGLSIKYSNPVVGDPYIFETGYAQKKDPWVPNVYLPSYDSLYFTTAYMGVLAYASELMINCIRFMCPKISNASENILNQLIAANYVRPFIGGNRPVLENLHSVKPAIDILLGPILNEYKTKPKAGKIVTLGKL